MTKKFSEQSWISVLVLSLITFGIYIPFWFKKIKRVTDTFEVQEKLNKALVTTLLIASFIIPFFSITITSSVNGAESVLFTTNVYGIGTILNILRWLLIVLLSFQLKKVIDNSYGTDLNAVLTFFLGPIFLQHKINSLPEKSSESQQTESQKEDVSDEVNTLVDYIQTYSQKGFTTEQLQKTLIDQGYAESDIKEAISISQREQ